MKGHHDSSMTAPIDIIIPVFNEEEALPGFHDALTSLPIDLHPIYIDNGSTDNSLQFIESLEDVTIIRQDVNRGYGASLKAGIRRATSDKIVIIDGDGEYHPDVIPEIVKALDHHAVVHTSRFLDKQHNSGVAGFRYIGNAVTTAIFNALFSRHLTDLYTGCKGYRRACVTDLPLHRDGFEHVLEISARLVRQDIGIKEIPVRYRQREKGKSKMRHFRETMKYLALVLYYRVVLRKQ
jgi:glycosyltransferase involved in cell wall biosynthesis